MRVALALDEQRVRPVGMWVVETPAVQRPSLAGPYVAVVQVAGRSVLLQSLGDPFRTRSIQRPEEVGHYYVPRERTTVHVDVPLSEKEDVGNISIRIADLSGVADAPADWHGLAALLERAPTEVRWLPSVESADLMKHHDWRQVSQ